MKEKMIDNMKFRHELKYKCNAGQIAIIKNRIRNFLELDKNVQKGQGYLIRSLYFDDYYNSYFYENENGTDPREKFRIRIYNCNKQRIALECKRKQNGKTHKTSCLLTEEQFDIIMKGSHFSDINSLNPLLRKFVLLVKTKLLKPAVIVQYYRIPYVHKLGNVRITLDLWISSSVEFEEFFSTELKVRPVLPIDEHLLEVKYDEFIPDYIKEILQTENLQHTAFSKYYLCRKYTIRGVL